MCVCVSECMCVCVCYEIPALTTFRFVILILNFISSVYVFREKTLISAQNAYTIFVDAWLKGRGVMCGRLLLNLE